MENEKGNLNSLNNRAYSLRFDLSRKMYHIIVYFQINTRSRVTVNKRLMVIMD